MDKRQWEIAKEKERVATLLVQVPIACPVLSGFVIVCA